MSPVGCMQISATRRLECLKMVSEIDRLEDPFAVSDIINSFLLRRYQWRF